MHTLPGCKYYSYLLINVEIKDKNRWKKLNESVINGSGMNLWENIWGINIWRIISKYNIIDNNSIKN